jgi:uncharacterized protein with PIN domain
MNIVRRLRVIICNHLRWGQPALARHGDHGFPDNCFTYELTREMREPVLWKGEDFGHTDLRAAVSLVS